MLACQPYTILITDDDPAARETLREVFEPQGYRTYLAESGEEAIDIVKDHDVHLALMDMHLPRLSGLETIAIFRQMKGVHPDDPDLGRSGREPAAQGPLRACLLRAGQAGLQARGDLRGDQGAREVLHQLRPPIRPSRSRPALPRIACLILVSFSPADGPGSRHPEPAGRSLDPGHAPAGEPRGRLRGEPHRADADAGPPLAHRLLARRRPLRMARPLRRGHRATRRQGLPRQLRRPAGGARRSAGSTSRSRSIRGTRSTCRRRFLQRGVWSSTTPITPRAKGPAGLRSDPATGCRSTATTCRPTWRRSRSAPSGN